MVRLAYLPFPEHPSSVAGAIAGNMASRQAVRRRCCGSVIDDKDTKPARDLQIY